MIYADYDYDMDMAVQREEVRQEAYEQAKKEFQGQLAAKDSQIAEQSSQIAEQSSQMASLMAQLTALKGAL